MNPLGLFLKYFVLFLTSLTFLMSTGLFVDIHYCQNQVKRISIIGKAKTCQEVAACQKAKTCHRNSPSCATVDHQEEGCCHNRSTFVKNNIDLVQVDDHTFKVFSSKSLKHLIFDIRPLTHINTKNTILSNYWPPPPKTKVQILFQQFIC